MRRVWWITLPGSTRVHVFPFGWFELNISAHKILDADPAVTAMWCFTVERFMNQRETMPCSSFSILSRMLSRVVAVWWRRGSKPRSQEGIICKVWRKGSEEMTDHCSGHEHKFWHALIQCHMLKTCLVSFLPRGRLLPSWQAWLTSGGAFRNFSQEKALPNPRNRRGMPCFDTKEHENKSKGTHIYIFACIYIYMLFDVFAPHCFWMLSLLLWAMRQFYSRVFKEQVLANDSESNHIYTSFVLGGFSTDEWPPRLR